MATMALFIAKEASASVGIATGSPTGTYYQIGNDVKKLCASAAMPITVYESTGSLSNVERVLDDKLAQYAIVQQDALAYKALSDAKAKQKIKMIFPLYNEEIHLVSANPNITSLQSLAGKRVIVGTDGSGNWVTSQIIKAKTGIQWTDVELSPDQGLAQLLLGQADAMFVVAGKPVKVLTGLNAASGKLKLVNMSHPALDSFYIPTVIPDTTYEWNRKRTQTYAVKSILITYDFKSQYQKEIENLTSCIVKNLDNFQSGSYHAKWREVDPSDYKSVQWPIHPVAEKFLQKNR